MVTKPAPAPGEASSPVPEESKADKFKRLGNARIAKALAAISNIGGLANKGSYEYTDEQVTALGKALEAEVIKTVGRFTNPNTTAAPAVSIL